MLEILNKLNSSDPFKIAEELDIHILGHELDEIYGYYCKIHDSKFIVLNKDLSTNDRVFTCAHELGHALLHPDAHTPMLTRKSMTSNLKIEREANEFATRLLIDGSDKEFHIVSKYKLLDFYGIPHEMERFV